MSPHDSRQRWNTRRRRFALAGLVVGCLAIVEAKSATAPPTHRVSLGPTTASPPTGRAGSSSAAGTTVRSVAGSPYDIGYGVVQVKVVLHGNRITDVIPLQLPSGGRSGEIASSAVPQLRGEVLSAQSANIDMVSGASYTSDGYAKSVQSALDAARG